PEDTVRVNPAQPELFLTDNLYSVLEDPTGQLRLHDVQNPRWAGRFQQLSTSGQPPNIQRVQSTYWLRLTVRHAPAENEAWYLELYDSHTGQAVFYRPQNGSNILYDSVMTGAKFSFATRPHPYKNFLFDLPPRPGQT
ncbi:7TM-DISM domain-containing protein, partial [Bradyrhizobium sp. NBAIM08]|uniref:7TMR-DISMED2 domain-containing protein n=1 Tax=Bradyrhizobium sp. NBAIM08 TaxID=2793815 RepID=UPI001CD80870